MVNAVIDFVNTHNRGSLEESGGIMFYPDPHNFYQGDELPGEFTDKFKVSKFSKTFIFFLKPGVGTLCDLAWGPTPKFFFGIDFDF